MKKTAVILIGLMVVINASAQEIPDWVFYFAFEDATGSKDTVWLAMDEEGTFDADEQFGEVAQNMNEEEFHVYFFVDNEGGKSDIKVLPLSNPPDGFIYAENYQYPITLSWDTTLFNAPILFNSVEGPINNPLLDNEYFFNFHPGFPSYHMLFEESVEMPFFNFGSMEHFPLFANFNRGFGDPLRIEENMQAEISIHPNPAKNIVNIVGASQIDAITIYDLHGRVVLSDFLITNPQLDISSLSKGIYLVETLTQNDRSVSKLLKVD